MADLVAEGPEPFQRWRRQLTNEAIEVVGRQTGIWSISWDERISRRHMEIRFDGSRLHVKRLPKALNPIYFRGQRVDEFSLVPGEHFVVGATLFTLVEESPQFISSAPRPDLEKTFDAAELRQVAYREPDRRLATISRLPEIISSSANDEETHVRLASLLLAGIDGARAVAIVAEKKVGSAYEPHVLHWDERLLASGNFRPSSRLIRAANEGGQSVLHIWGHGRNPNAAYKFDESTSSSEVMELDATMSRGVDWAFACPIPGETTKGWQIYVAGAFPRSLEGTANAEWLQDDLKLTEFAARTFGRLRDARIATQRQAGLRQFFAPIVLSALDEHPTEDPLAPRETEVTVLFCDLRGFSKKSEQESANLMGLLKRVSEALGVMTRNILVHGGVVGDFHGDAAMGFWGWPIAQEDAAQRACRAAQAIRDEFEGASRNPEHAEVLAGFQVGIGVATGKAVAGKIGSIDQVKVTVFGPVVNLASRLEGMTKYFRVPVLLDDATAAKLQASKDARPRVRRVARAFPAGMETAVGLVELLPPLDSPANVLNNEDVATYERGLDAFIAGDWEKAYRELRKGSADDRMVDILTSMITQHSRVAPRDWDGAIHLTSK